MSSLETTTFENKQGMDLDLIGTNYYKLPFCDEDLEDFSFWKWEKRNTDDDLFYDIQYHHTSPLSSPYCLSPSSSSSGSSSGQHTDPAHSLLNERPDTPLIPVNIEDFSNSYGMGNPYSNGYQDIDMLNFDCDVNTNNSNHLEFSVGMQSEEDGVISGSEKTAEYFESNTASFSLDKNSTITISKAKDGSAFIRPVFTDINIKQEITDHSYENNRQEVTSSFSTEQSTSVAGINSTDVSMTCTPSTRLTLAKCFNLSNNLQKSNKGDVSCSSDVTALPSNQKLKVLPPAKIATNTFTHKTQIQIPTSALQNILKNGKRFTALQHDGQVLPKIRVKSESIDDSSRFVKITQPQTRPCLPLTPPSTTSSDTESSSSPGSRGSCSVGPNSPIQRSGSNHRMTLTTRLLASAQRYTETSGPISLTDEEKRTLIAEGFTVPSKLPLTKSEEKSLKKVRRKIKNKLSAQESRRKKREYVETLEKKMDVYNRENMDLKRKLDSLESSNRSLLGQLRSLQTLVAGKIPKSSRSVTTQTSSCLMMVVLCFAVIIGGWYPHFSPLNLSQHESTPAQLGLKEYDIGNWRSRVLTSFQEDASCYGDAYCYGNLNTLKDEKTLKDNPGETENPAEDTYDEPTGGRVTMNDTGDQSKIIANTMEPRTPADVLASRKIVMQGAEVEVLVDPSDSHHFAKNVVMSVKPITE